MSFESLLGNPKYHSAIIRSTGLLSGQERMDRIKTVLERNVWLAARCKNTCVLEEDAVTDLILLKCASLFEERQNPLAIVALLELGEVGVLCYLSHMNDAFAFSLYNDPNQSVAHLFSILGENLSADLFWNVYHTIEALGYPMDVDLYNLALARLPREEDTRSILNNMESSGVKADALTYYYLISKSTTYQEAFAYFNVFWDENPEDDNLILGAIDKMIDLAPSGEEAERLYLLANIGANDSFKANKVRVSYLCRRIELSKDFIECSVYLEELKVLLASVKKRKAKYFGFVIAAFCRRISEKLTIDISFFNSFSLFCEMAQIVSPRGFFKKKLQNHSRIIFDSAIKNVVKQMPSTHWVFELFRIMDSCLLQVNEEVVRTAVEIAETRDYLLKLLEKYSIGSPDPRWVVSCLQRLKWDTADCLYTYLAKRDYPFNIFIFNTLIKKTYFDKAIEYLDEMEGLNISPDIYTIQALMKKFRNRNDFLTALSIASDYRIPPDDQLYKSILKRTEYDKNLRQIILSINPTDTDYLGLTPQWERFLAEVHHDLKRG